MSRDLCVMSFLDVNLNVIIQYCITVRVRTRELPFESASPGERLMDASSRAKQP